MTQLDTLALARQSIVDRILSTIDTEMLLPHLSALAITPRRNMVQTSGLSDEFTYRQYNVYVFATGGRWLQALRLEYRSAYQQATTVSNHKRSTKRLERIHGLGSGMNLLLVAQGTIFRKVIADTKELCLALNSGGARAGG